MEIFLNFDLPKHLIAALPSVKRGNDRIMLLQGQTRTHLSFVDALSHLKKGDLLVFNNSKVLKARLFFTAEKTGTTSELLLIEQKSPHIWTAMIKKSRRFEEGDILLFENRRACIGKRVDESLKEIIFDEPFHAENAEQIGEVPLPPYILKERKKRGIPPIDEEDENRYQTVFAKHYGSVAAPTASLRFTEEILNNLKARGIRIAEATLHVGIGTFKPMDRPPEEFIIHSEKAEISPECAKLVAQTKAEGGRVIAAGTTACRVLEAFEGKAFQGSADIFIKPGYQFKVVDGLLTNFHLPQSTLLLLVQALAGSQAIHDAYLEAVSKEYQFFSYGDGMLVLP